MLLQVISNIGASFILGLLTPLTAVCVLPLYPGFLAYLANSIEKHKEKKNVALILGSIIVFGVISFMFLLGVIFSFVLEISLTEVIGVVSPVAFGLLAIISLFLILDIDVGRFIPKSKTPHLKNPYLSAYIFGFFFGAIVVPCNPLFIAALFARGISIADFSLNVLNFIAFGFGIGAPLFVLALISIAKSQAIISFMVQHKTKINRIAGVIMFVIALYYLIIVF